MRNEQIERLCQEKEQELLNKYFGNLIQEAAHERPETIGEYSKDLPLRIEAEYKTFLEELWKEYALEEYKGTPLVLEEQKLRKLMTDDDRELINEAYTDATEQTFTFACWNLSRSKCEGSLKRTGNFLGCAP